MVNEKGQPVYSYSQLNTFRTCPYAWKKIYVDRAPRENNAFASYGSLVHELLEQCAKGELPREALRDSFEWQFDTAVPEEFPPNKYVDLHDSYFAQGVKFFESFEGFDGIEVLGVEEHFEIDRGGYALQGFIDLIYRDEKGRLICRDWKSAKQWPKRDLAEHAIQPYLYAAHIRERYNRYPDALEFYHFRDERKRSLVPFNLQEYDAALRWADETAEMIRTAWDFPHTYDAFFCGNLCSCRSGCEYRERGR